MINRAAYAVNLAGLLELTRRPADLPLLLLLRGIVTETVITPLGADKWGHDSLLVCKNIDTERWQALVKIIRSRLRYNELPLYEKGARGWKTIR